MQLKYSQASSFHDIPVIMFTVICDPLKRKLLASSAAGSALPSASNSPMRSRCADVQQAQLYPCFTYLRCFAAVHDVLMNVDLSENQPSTNDSTPRMTSIIEQQNGNVNPEVPSSTAQRGIASLFSLIEAWSLTKEEVGRAPQNEIKLQNAEEALIDIGTDIVTSFLLVKGRHDEVLLRHNELQANNHGTFVKGMGLTGAEVSSNFNVVKNVTQVARELKSTSESENGTHSSASDALSPQEKLRKTVNWLARHLLHFVFGLHTLKKKDLEEGISSFSPAEEEEIPPVCGMLYILSKLWEGDKVALRFDRDVIESWEGHRVAAVGHVAFSPLLPLATKVYAVCRACSAFSFALYALMTSPKTRFMESLTHSLEVSGVFIASALPQIEAAPTTHGLLSNLLKIKASYDENPSERLWKQRHTLSSPPHQIILMMLRQVSRLLRVHLPEFMSLLEMWSDIPVPEEEAAHQHTIGTDEDVETHVNATASGASPGHALLVDACRSWFETLFDAPNVPRTASNIYEAEQRNSGGITALLSPADTVIFWTRFAAFGWPFVMKLALQIITEAFSPTSHIATLQGGAESMFGNGLKITDPGEALTKQSNDRFAEIVRRSNYIRETPAEHLPMSPFGPFLAPPGRPDGTTATIKRLHTSQRSLVSTINLLPLHTVDFEGCVRRSDQWDAALFFNMKHGDSNSLDPTAAEHLKAWESQFVCASLAQSKAATDKFNITKSVDSMCLRW